MKTVTIREAQHNLARILREVGQGRTVEVVRRKCPVARIVPVRDGTGASASIDWKGHGTRMAAVWGSAVVHDVDTVLDDLRG